jgi:hypothetical protein
VVCGANENVSLDVAHKAVAQTSPVSVPSPPSAPQ